MPREGEEQVTINSFDMSTRDWSELEVLHDILEPFKVATLALESSTKPVIYKYGRILLDILFRKLPPAEDAQLLCLRKSFCQGAAPKLVAFIDDPMLLLELGIC